MLKNTLHFHFIYAKNNSNNILKNQVKFLMECISNQMKNLELLCKSNKTNLIPKENLKPYYEKTYKCDIYI